MKYLLMICTEEKSIAKLPEGELHKLMAEYVEFTKSIRMSGHYLGGSRLQPTSTATCVRVRDGKRLTTDGPFAETREQLGGYYMVEAKDLDEALSMAARIPGARLGTIEVRPIAPTPAD
jgi:hypothetical protein